MLKKPINYKKLEDEFYSVIAHASAGSDFDEIQMAVDGCINEVAKAVFEAEKE